MTTPPTCIEESVSGMWAQSGQAFAVAVLCWLIASIVVPVLVASQIKNEHYHLVIFFGLLAACGFGYLLGDFWVSTRFPEQNWDAPASELYPMLGIVWVFFVTTQILVGMMRGIALEDFARERI